MLLKQMSAATAARTDPGTAALQHVIISRVNPHCSELTSRVQHTAVINYPLCSNRNSFLASYYWSGKPFFGILIGLCPHTSKSNTYHKREKSDEKYDGGNWRKQIGLSSTLQLQLKLRLQTTIRPISFTAYHRHQGSDRSPAWVFAARLHPFLNLLPQLKLFAWKRISDERLGTCIKPRLTCQA